MNNSLHTIRIAENLSRTATIKLIRETLESHPGVVVVDLLDVGFPLHRDFFLVLTRKFPSDRYILRVKNEKIATVAKGLGIQTEIAGIQTEFERTYTGVNLATHNMSMLEYLRYEIRRGWMYLKFVLFERKKKENKILYYKKTNSNVILIVAGLIASIALLGFIFYFAVSKTIVTIVPQITVRPVSANIVYQESNASGSILSNRSILTMKHMSIPVEVKTRFKLESIDPNSAMNARGTITIYNELTVKQDLRPGTRFVTTDGVVFRSRDWISIPASRSINGITEMGVVEVEIFADPYDESGKIIGKRGNILASSDLTIPWLKFNRDRVYAKAKQDFTGGDDPRVHVVTEEEVKRFEGVLAEQIQKVGREELQKKLDTDRSTTGEDFALLVADMVTLTGTTYSITSGQKIWDTAEEIEMRANTTVTAAVFDRKATIDALTQVFREGLLRGTDKELAIHEDTLRVSNVVSTSEDGRQIKATLEMNTSITYDFENVTNELTRRLKTIIAGLPKQVAIDRLINEGNVREVQIQSSPFWLSNVSSNIDNIEFVIKK